MATLQTSSLDAGWSGLTTSGSYTASDGGGFGRFTSTGSSNYGQWTSSVPSSTTDVGLLFRMRSGTNNNLVRVHLRGVSVPAQYAQDSYGGANWQWEPSAPNYQVYWSSGSAGGSVVNTTSFSGIPLNTWTWLRFEIQGTTFRWKYWLDGTTEPTSWFATGTSPAQAPQSGQVFLSVTDYGQRVGNTLDLDDITVYDFTGPVVQDGAASLSSASNLTAAATVTRFAAATLSSASNLTASGARVTTGVPSALSALSSLSADGEVRPPIDGGSIALSATGDLLDPSGLVTTFGSASLSAIGDLIASAREPEVLLGESELVGSSDLQAEAWVEVFAEVGLTARTDVDPLDGRVYPIRWQLLTPGRRVPHGGSARISAHVQGITVVRDRGFWTTVEHEVDFSLYERVFLGGYRHFITKADYDELVQAGYGEYLTVLLPQVPADPVGTGFGSGPFGDGPYGSSAVAYGQGSFNSNSYQEGT